MSERNERVSDDERQGALTALGEHFAKGRLDMAEYEERTERAVASVTFKDLDDLFTDLPLPHYETGLAVRETAGVPSELTDEQVKRRNKRLSKIEDAGWGIAGIWVPIWFVFFGSLFPDFIDIGWFGAFIPMLIMGAYSVAIDILYADDDDEEE